MLDKSEKDVSGKAVKNNPYSFDYIPTMSSIFLCKNLTFFTDNTDAVRIKYNYNYNPRNGLTIDNIITNSTHPTNNTSGTVTP